MSAFQTIRFEKRDDIGCITLNRPEALNAFNIRMRDELYEVLSAVGDDDEIRVVIVNGAGDRAFCAGADLSEFLTAPPPTAARKIRFDRDVWRRLVEIPQPMIASMHGFVLGSGLEIALGCDLRICSEEAHFGLPEMRLGMIPAAGGTQTLPRVVGPSRVLEMMWRDEWLNADEALGFGLVNRVVPRGQLEERTREMAARIAGFRPEAVKKAKQAVIRGADLSLAEGLRVEALLAQQVRRQTANRSLR